MRFLSVMALAVIAASAQSQVITPAQHANLEGNTSAYYYYYGAWWYSTSSTTSRMFRLQHVVDHDKAVKGSLSAITFRRDGASYAGLMSPAFWTEIEVTLSTAKTTSTTMSSTYANNIGTDATVVIAKKKYSVASKPYVATFPEPFLLGFVFDKKFTYDASKGSILIDVKEFDNSLYNTTTSSYSYCYADGCYSTTSSGASLMSGPRCFNGNPYATSPMRHYSYGYYDSTNKKLKWYFYGYDSNPMNPAVIVWTLGKSTNPIPLDCGKFELDFSSTIMILTAVANSTGYFRYPSSGYMEIPWDTTMKAYAFYSQAVVIDKNLKMSATNYYIKNTPLFLPSGTNFPQRMVYSTGSSAHTATSGSLRTLGYGPVLQWTGIQ